MKKTTTNTSKLPYEGFKSISKAIVHTDANGNKILYPAVFETFTYILLEFLTGINRPVKTAHVSKMGASVTQLLANLRDVVVVKIGFRYYLADGQNLYTFLSSVFLPIRFKLIEAKNKVEALQIIARLNSSSKNWTVVDFVNAWCNFNPSFKLLKGFQERYQLTYLTIASLLAGVSSTQVKKRIEDGTFEPLTQVQATKFFRAIDNFYNRLGMERYKYTTVGLIEAIKVIGLDTYLATEHTCLARVAKTNEKENRTETPFARAEDAREYFLRCWK